MDEWENLPKMNLFSLKKRKSSNDQFHEDFL